MALAEAELIWPRILADAADGELRPLYGAGERWQEVLDPPALIPAARAQPAPLRRADAGRLPGAWLSLSLQLLLGDQDRRPTDPQPAGGDHPGDAAGRQGGGRPAGHVHHRQLQQVRRSDAPAAGDDRRASRSALLRPVRRAGGTPAGLRRPARPRRLLSDVHRRRVLRPPHLARREEEPEPSGALPRPRTALPRTRDRLALLEHHRLPHRHARRGARSAARRCATCDPTWRRSTSSRRSPAPSSTRTSSTPG